MPRRKKPPRSSEGSNTLHNLIDRYEAGNKHNEAEA